jgi:hypothetical protein
VLSSHSNANTDRKKHVLPLAGLTAGLALMPKRSVSAEERSSDPLAAMVWLQCRA